MPKDNRRHIVQRLPKRADYDIETVNSILDEALTCNVSFVVDGQPFLIPTIHARSGNQILLHGLKGGRMLKHIEAGGEICISVMLLDGLVIARSVFNHSMNYRSVVVFGTGSVVTDEETKMAGMKRFVDHLTPGGWDYARQPNPKEMKATTIVAIDMVDVSAKIRSGPPGDDDADYELPIWAGVIPLHLQAGDAITDPVLKEGIEMPEHFAGYQPDTR